MGWADHYITKLRSGETVTFRPHGNSMTPRIKSGALCTVEPLTMDSEIKLGDVVLCKVRGAQYLHLVKAQEEDRVLIGNNHGRINGWTNRQHIYGRLIAIAS